MMHIKTQLRIYFKDLLTSIFPNYKILNYEIDELKLKDLPCLQFFLDDTSVDDETLGVVYLQRRETNIRLRFFLHTSLEEAEEMLLRFEESLSQNITLNNKVESIKIKSENTQIEDDGDLEYIATYIDLVVIYRNMSDNIKEFI